MIKLTVVADVAKFTVLFVLIFLFSPSHSGKGTTQVIRSRWRISYSGIVIVLVEFACNQRYFYMPGELLPQPKTNGILSTQTVTPY